MNNSINRLFSVFFLSFTLISSYGNAVLYNISPVANFGTGTLSGSFDLTGSSLTSVNLTTTGTATSHGDFFFNATYRSGFFASNTATFNFNDSGNHRNSQLVLTFSGSTIVLANETQYWIEYNCSPLLGCLFPNAQRSRSISLSIGPVVLVPEPSTYVTLAGMMTIALIAITFRRQTKHSESP